MLVSFEHVFEFHSFIHYLFADKILLAWNILLQSVDNAHIEPLALSAFVQEHFEQPGGELEDFYPEDFNPTVIPQILDFFLFENFCCCCFRKSLPTLSIHTIDPGPSNFIESGPRCVVVSQPKSFRIRCVIR